MKNILICTLAATFVLGGCTAGETTPPEPFGPVPSERQLAWHETGTYAFIHLTTNTFRDLEWGYGDADPDEFCPEKLDAEQWVRTIKAAGMKGVIITAKHHDGFCLWPSEFTDYSVKNSKWRDGKGDVVGDLSAAAKKYGLKFGVYLSPWDRHDIRYGTQDYIDYYRNQITELIRNYGPVFEVWEDGANGGDGWYGGLCEKRTIDRSTYYDWPTTDDLIHELQPEACIFSDGGPDVRWCGNESGFVGETNWCMIKGKDFAPGKGDGAILNAGDPEGTDWIPAEVDVSIRPGWFWHESQNDKVKTVSQLMDIYYNSVGRGANLILNIPPNKDGLFDEADVKSLEGFGRALEEEFAFCLNSRISKVEATDVRGRRFSARKAVDEDHATYWCTKDNVNTATLTCTFRESVTVNRMMLREHIALGQRIESFKVEAQDADGSWKEIASATTIGNKRLLRFEDVQTKAMRISITGSKACPVISDVNFYCSR